MVDKTVHDPRDAFADMKDGAAIMVSGFGDAGLPLALLDAVLDVGVRGLTIISNNAGSGQIGIARLLAARRVRKLICSFPRQQGSQVFDDLYRKGDVELELVPQGTLAERIRAGGAGIGAFYTPTAVGTELAVGKDHRIIDGRTQLLEFAIRADFALVKGDLSDRWGNLTYHRAARNFGPIMATAADRTVAQVNAIVELGELDPEAIVTPGIFVSSVVVIRR